MPPIRREAPRRRVPLRRVALLLGGVVLLAAAIVAAILIAGRGDDGGSSDTAAGSSTAASQTTSETSGKQEELLRGIPQDGTSLGSPDAPLTLVEYADLQCPFCAQWSLNVFPTVVEEYVRTGRIRLVYRGLYFLGADSEKALRAALAAGSQDRLWDVVHALYKNQGAENEGWVTDDLLRSFDSLGVDTERMLEESDSAEVDREMAAAGQAAQIAGIQGTPSFEAGPSEDELERVNVDGLDAASFTAELDRLLAG